MKTNEYTLGLDLGITSVGFGVIDKNYNIIDYGVRLFEESSADNNLTRRTKRSARRLKSRKTNRINAIKYYMLNNNLIDTIDFPYYNNIYELRVKGLHNKLTNYELANVLVNIAKHRGSSLDIAIDEDDKEATAGKSALTDNTKSLRKDNLYICELQLKRLNESEDHKIRKTNNIFKTEDYEKELRQILSNQDLKAEQVQSIVDIVVRRRNFSEGPGSEEFPTPYGSYRLDVNNNVIKVNLIDEMRGKCSVFPNELRIAKNSYEACLFNLLNDLNNISYVSNGAKTKLSLADKLFFINQINTKGTLNPSQIAKHLGKDLQDLDGFRKDQTKEKIVFTKFDIYSKIIKSQKVRPEVYNSHIDFDDKGNFINSDNSLDKIIDILTKVIVVDERVAELKKLDLLDSEVEYLANLSNVNGYHSLSKKAMDEIIPEMIKTSKNQMQVITDNNLGNNKIENYGHNIEFNDEFILSPVAKRVFRQALLVVNTLRQQYGEFNSIVIETTRAKNSEEEKKNEAIIQKNNEESKARVDELLLQMKKEPNKFNTLQRLKLVLYKQQNCKTIYTGETIDLETLLNDPTAYQIEHIIPYSISFDNSLNNKALASERENQDKGNKTPWQYFSSGLISNDKPIHTFEAFKEVVNSLSISAKKKEHLLNQEDVTRFDNMEQFVERNLNDTSYGIRCVMNTLKDYYKRTNITTKVFTIKGKQTHTFRSRVGLTKDRDIYIHHAIDALIIAGFRYQKEFYKAFNLSTEDNVTFNAKTGELIDFDNPLDDQQFIKYLKELKQIEPDPLRFSYKIDTKTNRQFSDETIYSTRVYDGKEFLIKKFKDIYGKEGLSLKKIFDEKKYDKLLVYKNDKESFEILKEIVAFYGDQNVNPFAKYKEEHGYIRKYSKDGNGPIIKSIKYVDSELGNHLDISKNYKLNGNKHVVLLQTTPYRTDIYKSHDGTYKFITVRRYHVKQIDGKNVIDTITYSNLRKIKKISDDFKFMFSLNRNNIIFLKSQDNSFNGFYRFIGTKSDLTNVIELKDITMATSTRITPTIGKKIIKIEKYNVSPTGKYSKVIKENLKLVW